MEVDVIINTYFGWEKSSSIILMTLGLLGIGLGMFFWIYHKSDLLQGVIVPLLLLGLISGIIGSTIFFRTNTQVENLKQTYQQERSRFFSEEQTRMQKVNRNWRIYKIIELIIILASITTLFLAYRQDFWVGFSMAALLMASSLLVIDIVGERNGLWYVEKLQSISKNMSHDDS